MGLTVLYVGDTPLLKRSVVDQDTNAVDLSTNDAIEFKLQYDGGSVVTKASSWQGAGDGSDGLIEYQVEEGVIDQAGIWHVWINVDLGANQVWQSSPVLYEVRPAGDI